MTIFNSTLFNKAIFNTKFIPTGGVSKRRFKKLPKQLMETSASLRVSSGLVIPVYLAVESKMLTEFYSNVESKISYPDSIPTSSKILADVYKPVSSVVTTDGEIGVVAKFDNIELKLNKMYKGDTVRNILSLLDI